MKNKKEYAVYGHFYQNVIFYIGCGIYDRNDILKSRPYNFYHSCRSEEWLNYCERNTDQIKVHIFLRTNDQQEALNFEEKLTQHYIDHNAPLVNVNIGNRHSEEWIKKYRSGENHPAAKRVLTTNNLTNDTRTFGTIKEAHKFITKKGYTKKYNTLKRRLRNGLYTFNNYTLEIIA